jgi:hypothetical protein
MAEQPRQNGTRAPRSPGMNAAARRFSLIDAARRQGIPVEELAGREAERRTRAEGQTRRELLAGATAMAAGAALASHPAAAS